MEIYKLEDMIKGWFVGNFNQSVMKTSDFEVAVKKYKAGDRENLHVHKVATEITVIVYGRVVMNEVEYTEGDIIKIAPGEPTDFHVLTDCCTVVVKNPSVTDDKYVL